MPDKVLVDDGWFVVLVQDDWSGLTQTVATISRLHSRYPLTQEDVVQFLMRNGAELLLAKNDSGIEGFALIIPEESPQKTTVLRIRALAVDPEVRRKGLGRVLLQGVYALAGKLGTRPVMTIADDDSEGKRFLNALGFRAAGRSTEGRREFRGSPQGPPATTATGERHRRQPPASVYIRWMIRRDMPEVLRIERRTSAHPWREEDFIRCLRRRNSIGMVADLEERDVGFMVYELWPKCIFVLKLAVDRYRQRRKIGTRLVEKLVSKLAPSRRTHLCVLVPRGSAQPSAETFLRRCAFTEEIPKVLTKYAGVRGDVWVYRLAGAAPMDLRSEIIRRAREERYEDAEEAADEDDADDEDDTDDEEDEGQE